MRINANTGSHAWTGGSFRPNGRLIFVGTEYKANPRTWGSKNTLAARLFIGLNVGGEPRWSVDHVTKTVTEVRAEQGRRPDSSFIVQRGIYTSRSSGEVIHEDSVQVILIDVDSLKRPVFTQEIETLAETLARELKQEEIVVEIQRNGMALETFGVAPV